MVEVEYCKYTSGLYILKNQRFFYHFIHKVDKIISNAKIQDSYNISHVFFFISLYYFINYIHTFSHTLQNKK